MKRRCLLSRMLLLLFAAQSTPCSGAVVHHANLRIHSNSSMVDAFSESVWHNPITNLVQREIEMTRDKPPMVNKLYYVIFAMIFGCCGCDRCYMGQTMLGCIKAVTFGGMLIWHAVDFFVCLVIALTKAKDINILGFNATFDPKTINSAFWVALIIFIWNIISQYSQAQQMKEMNDFQSETQANLEVKLNESGPEEDEDFDGVSIKKLDIPKRHQPLAYIPTILTKGLRKAGIVTKRPTVPELIAAFQKMDKDGNGLLDREEIQEALAAMGAGDDEVDEMIKSADTDGDGKINKDEFLIIYSPIAKPEKEKEAKEGEKEQPWDAA